MYVILKPTFHLIGVFALFTLASFISFNVLTPYDCTLSEPATEYVRLFDIQLAVQSDVTWLLALATLICALPIVPYAIVKSRKFEEKVTKNNGWKALIVNGFFIVTVLLLIFVLGSIVYTHRQRTNLFWGYLLLKSFFSDVRKYAAPEMLPARLRIQLSTGGQFYDCHFPSHKFHNFIFMMVYFYLVFVLFRQLFNLLSNIFAVANVSVEVKIFSCNFSFGKSTDNTVTDLPTSILAVQPTVGEDESQVLKDV
ncbi:hypothetical protein QR680_003888 [Steinernema hermaphroditum]|uniref:Uncharacterized protein n=1 Tax=Steinernema hermaphroditum TaxID=289476 RepID=A0AA39HLY6_9BILA|nr:hypothetical protein QR680_003888 [Steinernema hermaphroditum]